MATVTGQIVGADGIKDVSLNNAATEATLRALLAATAKTEEGIKSAMSLASKAGLDPATVAQVGQGLTSVTTNSKQAGDELSNAKEQTKELKVTFMSLMSVTGKLIEGSAGLSSVLGSMASLFPQRIEYVLNAFSALAKFQETSIASYRELTSVGANFSGSLYDMRLAASNSYLSLKEFTEIVRNNGTTFAKMGGTVDDGVRSFAILNNSLITSEVGSKLLSLGYSTEDVSKGMLSFINATGGRSKEELLNTNGITAATGEYLTELDKLTQLSGISRKQQEEEQKKAAANAAYQRVLSNMTEEQKVRAEVGRQAAAMSGIAGAQDAYMSRIAGLPPITKDARQFVGIFGQAANGVYQMADQARSATGTLAGVERGLGNFNEGVVDGVNRIGTAGDVLSYTNQTVSGAGLRAIQLQKQGADTAEGSAKQLEATVRKQIAQNNSQAKTAADTELEFKKIGNTLLSALYYPMQGISLVLKTVADRFYLIGGALLAFYGTLKYLQLRGKADSALSAGATSFLNKFSSLGSINNPMYVIVLRSLSGTGGNSLSRETANGRYPENAAERAARLEAEAKAAGGRRYNSKITPGVIAGAGIAGLGLGMGANYLKENDHPTAGAYTDVASSALTGAALGAELGTVFPVIGNLVGAAVGGALGAGVGLFQNWDAIGASLKSDSNKKKKELTPEAELLQKLHAEQQIANAIADRRLKQAQEHYEESKNNPQQPVIINTPQGTGRSAYPNGLGSR